MEYLKSIIMGIIQGLTEFLPVSSSGHLRIFSEIFKMDTETSLAFTLLLHIGTLVAVIIAFRKTVLNLIIGFFTLIRDIFTGKFSWKKAQPYQKMVIFVVIATIPLVIVALLGLDDLLLNIPLLWVGVCLLITASILYTADRVAKGNKTAATATVKDTLFVALFQCIAIAPGISRSGSTISAGLFAGFDRKYAIEFSFVMSIPAILGGAVLELPDLFESGVSSSLFFPYFIGAVFAAISGYSAIVLVKKLISNDRFAAFSYYCVFAGLATIICSLFR